MRGLFWVCTFPVLDSDEGQHFSYVESVATGHGIPVTGRDHVTPNTLRFFKEDHVGRSRSTPITPYSSDPSWSLAGQQYEGFQGPLYYLLMIPFYWAGRLVGLLGAVYVLRAATLLLTLLGAPLTYLLAREVVPERPVVWLLSPACLVSVQLFNSQFSLITNDGIMVPLGALCLLTFLRCRRGFTVARGAAFGIAVGLCSLARGQRPPSRRR
jgi:hypothetical protein